jgi:ABC-2 type transport system permease protein
MPLELRIENLSQTAMLREVFRFEIAYQLGRASTRVYFAIFLGFALVLARVFLMNARRDGYFFNAPIITAAVTIIASMVALLVAAGVAGDAATRDAESRMDVLLFTTPLRKSSYLGGRFLGAFAVTALLLLAVPLGLLLATWMPGIDARLLGPFQPRGYLAAYLLFAVPNAFVATAVLFSLAVLSRRALASYAGAAMLFFAAFLSESFVAARLGRWGAGRLLDPLGYTTLRALWRSSNPLQRNTLSIGLDPALVANRLLWLGLASGVLALACARFRFAHQAVGEKRARIDDAPAILWTGALVPAAPRVFGFRTRMRQLLAVASHEFRALVTSRGWLVVPLAAALFVVAAPRLLEVELGTPGAATTGRIATILGTFEPSLLLVLLTALYAGELVWRERAARIHALADVTPVPEWVSLIGKFLGLVSMLGAAETMFLLAGIAAQWMQGGAAVDLGLYVRILFGVHLTRCLLFAALAMVLHVLVNQKYVGNVVVLLAFVATTLAPELGVRHNLLLYDGAPPWSYSEMAGFAPQAGPWCWFTVYWAGWALLFGVVTYLFWIRGEDRGPRSRILAARRRLTRGPIAVAATALAIVAGAGGFIFYNTNVLHPYRTGAEVEQRRAEYERRYGKYASLPQPVLAATKLYVELYPERGAASIRGSYRLDNRSGAAIDAIHLATSSDVETDGISFDRPSRLTLSDDDLGYRIYALGRAVQPGESVRIDFRVAFAPRGFTNDGRDASVMRNGSWIEHRGAQNDEPRQWLPAVGYQAGRELDDTGTRRQYGLSQRTAVRPLDDAAARHEQRGREQIDFDAIVGTEAGQTAVAPGALRRTWTDHGRRYFHYVSDAPIANIYAIFSAGYAVHRARWRGVNIEIFHHPGHTANLVRMVRAVQASLNYGTRHFSPYPHRQLRLVEYPSSGGALGLTAYPGLIKYSEGFALVRPADDRRRIDLPFAVLAHEMGHQWWAHRLVPAPVEGAPLLTESLAWYSAMRVVEQSLGRSSLLRLLDVMRREYLAPHQTRMVPLLRAVDPIDAYRTGPFAMHALREAIGEDRVNLALRNLLAGFDPAHAPYPTSRDLYAELRAVTPQSMHALLKDLFEDITFWDLRTRRADVQPAGNRAWRVTLHVDARKLKADAAGRETPVPMDDLVVVGVFAADGRTLYRQRHRIHSGAQIITVTVMAEERPARAGVDPDHELLDRDLDDNDAPAESRPSSERRLSRVERRAERTYAPPRGSGCNTLTRFPSVSRNDAYWPMPGISIGSPKTVPPAAVIFRMASWTSFTAMTTDGCWPAASSGF